MPKDKQSESTGQELTSKRNRTLSSRVIDPRNDGEMEMMTHQVAARAAREAPVNPPKTSSSTTDCTNCNGALKEATKKAQKRKAPVESSTQKKKRANDKISETEKETSAVDQDQSASIILDLSESDTDQDEPKSKLSKTHAILNTSLSHPSAS
ncbi:hypothetical protein K435DRAFT_866338 [Dendrothele bispora CBS 962.96]|uniref:Uncharacterized protein n=1 Tax=Dendrothele bispora (strain CBS 962.96) TaxID=1314807 RepID=A0A4V4HDU1_DENBC|nr:hypothetical protein K435DRAFT_866338 [Dendrothele bispora CBS 962.96]